MDQIIDPPSVKVAKKQKDWPEWEVSIKVELDIHKKLDTSELVTAPPTANIIGSWIIRCYKLDNDGKIRISSCKSRLVAQGFTQQQGINFNDTFFPNSQANRCKDNSSNHSQKWLGAQAN